MTGRNRISCPLVLFVMSTAFILAAPLSHAAPPASWRMTADGPAGDGITLLDGADGCFAPDRKAGLPCVTFREGAQPAAAYLYFAVDPALKDRLNGPVWADVEYFDASPGGAVTLEYDSGAEGGTATLYRTAEDQWGGMMRGSGRWRRAVYELRAPRFGNGQNLGADFRLGYARLHVRSVTLAAAPPADRDTLNETSSSRLVRRARAGSDKRVILGGFDPDSAQSAALMSRLLEANAPVMKSVGITSHEGYVRWNLCEPEPGVYDWSVYDKYVDLYRRHGLKWVPFLIVGPAYSLPEWFYKKEGFQGYVCLEHGEESDVASLWNPVLRGHLARFIQAFCEHYRDSGVIDSILLGITGNYGEAIYIASGNDWTAGVYGDYHTHGGFWAGDPFAVADFRRAMGEKYPGIAELNAAWTTSFAGFGEIAPFLRKDAPNDRAWLDFADWYIASMNDYTRFWLENIRKHYGGPVEICTGGHAPAEHGADFGMQCKLAAEFGGGVRITNEASDYRANFSLTRWVASAGWQYGAYFSFEPAGEVRPEGVLPRIYNAAVSNARGLHYYAPNLFAQEKALDNWVRWASLFRNRRPRVEIAVHYPQTHIKLTENRFLEHVQHLRDYFDFKYLSDGQIADGGLEDTGALVLLWGNVAERETWDAVTDWVRRGGLVLYADGIGPLRTVGGDASPHDAIFGPGATTGRGRVARFEGGNDTVAYRRFLCDTLAAAPELSRATRRMVAEDGCADGVFASLTGARTLLWLNASGKPVRKAGRVIPEGSVVVSKW